MPRRGFSGVTDFVGLTLIYFLAGKLGLKLAFLHASASPVWRPAGVALVALLVLGCRTWPAIFVGAFLVNVTHDAGLQPRGPVPLGLPGYNASIPLFPFDLAQAAIELKATPYWISGFNLTLYYRAGNGYEEQGCRLLANGLEALHSQQGSPGVILVGVQSLDPAAYVAALHARGLPLALLSWAPRFADPLDSIAPFLRGGSAFPTWIGYGNATLDTLIDAAAGESNETTRVQDFLDLTARAVLDDVPYLWVFQATSFHVERAWVSGYYFNPMLRGLDYYPLSKS